MYLNFFLFVNCVLCECVCVQFQTIVLKKNVIYLITFVSLL